MSSVDCQGCRQPIKDQFIFKVLPDMQWHEHCLKCAECSTHLTDTCFIRHSKPYCRADYTKLFSNTHHHHTPPHNCDKCNLTLNRHDLIIKSKDRTFHLDCFKCSICARKLSPGDEYSHQPELNDLLLCKHDALNTSQYSPTPKLFLNTITNRYNHSSTMSLTPENSTSSSSLCSLSPSTASSSSSSSSSVTDSPCSNFNTTSNTTGYIGYTPVNVFHSGARVSTAGPLHGLSYNANPGSFHDRKGMFVVFKRPCNRWYLGIVLRTSLFVIIFFCFSPIQLKRAVFFIFIIKYVFIRSNPNSKYL
jgi:hypothetical protein